MGGAEGDQDTYQHHPDQYGEPLAAKQNAQQKEKEKEKENRERVWPGVDEKRP
jgi:hypothetical protein